MAKARKHVLGSNPLPQPDPKIQQAELNPTAARLGISVKDSIGGDR